MGVRLKIWVLLPAIAGLVACASNDARYPSLTMRPFETAPPASDAAPPDEPTRSLADPAILAELVARAVDADTAFTRQQPAAARLARTASGQPLESNARAAALVAIADLAARRGATTAVLAELDRLAADSAIAFAPVQDIETARAKVITLVEGQDIAIARLWEVMGP